VGSVVGHVAVQHVIQGFVATVLAFLTKTSESREIESPVEFVVKVALGALFLDTYQVNYSTLSFGVGLNEEFLQYWGHRWMHTNKWLYRNFHSVHHRLTVPYAYGALYNHPVEGFIMDILGSAIPAALLNMHPWTATFFFSIATIKTVDDHCGYALPWDPLQIVFPNNAAYHDIHHWYRGQRYNYSQPFFTFWDKWMGTDFNDAVKAGKVSASPERRQAAASVKPEESKPAQENSERSERVLRSRRVPIKA
jgi:sphinganine C4-monooxygenase